MPSRILIVAPDAVPLPVDDKNRHGTGCGIRAWRTAGYLARRGYQVILAIPDLNYTAFAKDVGFEVVTYDYYREEKEPTPTLVSLLKSADAVIYQPGKLAAARTLAAKTPAETPLILDLWVPNHVEYIPSIQRHGTGAERAEMYREWRDGVMTPLIRRADLFLYGHPRQRHYYVGLLSQAGRINPVTYDERILLEVPYGIPVAGSDRRRRHPDGGAGGKRPIRGVICPEDRFILLWFSGVYPWFDLATPIRAVAVATRSDPRIVLMVKGGIHPLYRRGSSLAVEQGKELARELGLLGERVYFDDEWCPQEEKGYWLGDADAAVVSGRESYESELACRVRSLDFVDHGLPVVNSGGDYVGELLSAYGLARTFAPGDVTGLAEILVEMSADRRLKARIGRKLSRFRREFAWDRCLEPLGKWLENRFPRERVRGVGGRKTSEY